MDVQSLSNGSPSPAQLPPVPIRSPVEVIERLRSFYCERNIELFRGTLDSGFSNGRLNIHSLDTIMMDSARNNTALVTMELLSYGLPLMPDSALEAAKSKAKNVLKGLFENVWDINSPISQAQSLVLR